MSNQTWYLTNPTDPTPVTVRDKSPSIQPDTRGSDDGFEHKKLIPNRIYTRKVVVLYRWVCFIGVLVRLVEIRWDLVEIRPNLDQIWWISAKSGKVSKVSTLTEDRPVFDEFRPPESTPFIGRQGQFQVGHKPDPDWPWTSLRVGEKVCENTCTII